MKIQEILRDAFHKVLALSIRDMPAPGNEPLVKLQITEKNRDLLTDELFSSMFLIPTDDYNSGPGTKFTSIVFPLLARADITIGDEEFVEYNGKRECLSFP